MKSQYFRCPHCGVKLKKSAAAFVMGEAGIPLSSGELAHVTCPNCGRAIDAQAMIGGGLDERTGPGGLVFGLTFTLTVVTLSAGDLGFWASAGLGLVVAAAVTFAWAAGVWAFKKMAGNPKW